MILLINLKTILRLSGAFSEVGWYKLLFEWLKQLKSLKNDKFEAL